jgi:hypothetical protein
MLHSTVTLLSFGCCCAFDEIICVLFEIYVKYSGCSNFIG